MIVHTNLKLLRLFVFVIIVLIIRDDILIFSNKIKEIDTHPMYHIFRFIIGRPL